MQTLIWVASTQNAMALNMIEGLELCDFSVILYDELASLYYSLKNKLPTALILDELNLSGCYNCVSPLLKTKDVKPLLITLNSDGCKKQFPLADFCIPLPFNTQQLAEALINYIDTENSDLISALATERKNDTVK